MSVDADYHAVLADLIERRKGIEAAIKTVEGIIAQLGLTPGSGKIRSTQDLPSDAFLSLTIPEAAIKYLGMMRSAQSVAQIWEALKKGGLTHTKYAAVYNAIFRRETQVGDVVKLPDGNWGLSEWYASNPSPRRKAKSGKPTETHNTDAAAGEPSDLLPPLAKEESKLSIVDATEELIRAAGKPLHASDLVSEIAAKYGKVTNSKSIAGTLPQDGKKRFKNLGKNTWTLVDMTEK